MLWEAISLARFAEDTGADAILSVVPYYNRPNQEGLFQHFSAIARSTGLPIILYSVPGRTVVDLQVDTISRLREAHDLCDEHHDVATASLIENWIDEGERRAWFLFEATRRADSSGR